MMNCLCSCVSNSSKEKIMNCLVFLNSLKVGYNHKSYFDPIAIWYFNFFLLLFVFYFFFCLHFLRLDALGLLSTVICSLAFFIPILAVVEAWNTKNAAAISIPITYGSLVCRFVYLETVHCFRSLLNKVFHLFLNIC